MIQNQTARAVFYFLYVFGGTLITTMTTIQGESWISFKWWNYVILVGGAAVTAMGAVMGYRDLTYDPNRKDTTKEPPTTP